MKKKPTVLIVEDSTHLRIALELMLEDRFSVISAETAVGAIQRITELSSIDLLITDLDLKDTQDGYDVALAFRTKLPRTPIVLATGFAKSHPRVARTLSLPTTHFLPKPFCLEDLETRLRDIGF